MLYETPDMITCLVHIVWDVVSDIRHDLLYEMSNVIIDVGHIVWDVLCDFRRDIQ